MGKVETALREEIARLARKEVRKATGPLKKEIVRLKKRVVGLAAKLSAWCPGTLHCCGLNGQRIIIQGTCNPGDDAVRPLTLREDKNAPVYARAKSKSTRRPGVVGDIRSCGFWRSHPGPVPGRGRLRT